MSKKETDRSAAVVALDACAVVEVYLPNRDRDGVLVSRHWYWVDLVAQTAADTLGGGGATVYETRGLWAGRWEDKTVVRVFTVLAETPAEALVPLREVLEGFKREADQETVGLTYVGRSGGGPVWVTLVDGPGGVV